MQGRPRGWFVFTLVAAVIAGGCGDNRDAVRPPGGTAGGSTVPASSSGNERLTVDAVYQPVCGPYRPSDPECPPVHLDGVTVTVRRAGDPAVTSGTTDTTGSVSFDVGPGSYDVEGAPDPRAAITAEPQVARIDPDTRVTVRLTYASNAQ